MLEVDTTQWKGRSSYLFKICPFVFYGFRYDTDNHVNI